MAAVALPVSETVGAEFEASLVMFRDPFEVPVTVGANWTVRSFHWPAAIVIGKTVPITL